ncbi:MAG: proton-conducting transporter membrane subunit [Peptococcaceae bacterium]|jgi:hydrogenase-4 component B|nr:proton-conducting transporter membrane subunit [Peptococcaceae bacterium]
MNLVQVLLGSVLVLTLLGALAGLRPGLAERAAYVPAALASLALLWGAGQTLYSGRVVSLLRVQWLPAASFNLTLDSLSAFFLLVAGLVFLAASVYGLAREEARSPASLYNLFLLSITGVLAAGNVLTFLVFWETMTVLSYLLVNTRHDRPGVARAGLVMLVMSQLGTALLLAAFFLLYAYGGSFDFITLRLTAAQMPPVVRDVVFLLALGGFGVKAGTVPFQVWLPLAHPVAPANTSAVSCRAWSSTWAYTGPCGSSWVFWAGARPGGA